MLHVDALSRNPLPMMINESSESIHAKIGKAQREDSDIEKMFAMVDQRQCEGYIARGALLFKESEGDTPVVPKSMQNQIRRVHDRGHFLTGKNRNAFEEGLLVPKYA